MSHPKIDFDELKFKLINSIAVLSQHNETHILASHYSKPLTDPSHEFVLRLKPKGVEEIKWSDDDYSGRYLVVAVHDQESQTGLHIGLGERFANVNPVSMTFPGLIAVDITEATGRVLYDYLLNGIMPPETKRHQQNYN